MKLYDFLIFIFIVYIRPFLVIITSIILNQVDANDKMNYLLNNAIMYNFFYNKNCFYSTD